MPGMPGVVGVTGPVVVLELGPEGPEMRPVPDVEVPALVPPLALPPVPPPALPPDEPPLCANAAAALRLSASVPMMMGRGTRMVCSVVALLLANACAHHA